MQRMKIIGLQLNSFRLCLDFAVGGNFFIHLSVSICLDYCLTIEFGCCLGMICKSLLLHTSQPMTMPMRKDMDKDRPQWCKSVFSVLSVSFFSM